MTINRGVGILSIHTIHYTGSNKPTWIDDDDDDDYDYDRDDYYNVLCTSTTTTYLVNASVDWIFTSTISCKAASNSCEEM